MIEINLLPPEIKKKRRASASFALPDLNKMTDLPIVLIVSSLVGFMIVVQSAVFIGGLYAKARLEGIQKGNRSIFPQVEEIKQLKAKIQEAKKRSETIELYMIQPFSWAEKLNDLSDSMTQDVWLTSITFDERVIERVVKQPKPKEDDKKDQRSKGKAKQPSQGAEEDQFDRKIEPEKKEQVIVRQLNIVGFAVSSAEEATVAITKFIESLKKNESFAGDFMTIEFGGPIEEAVIDEVEVKSFKINCFFK